MSDGNRPADVRMGVVVARLPVSSPARVPDAGAALEPGGHVSGEFGDPAFRLAYTQVAAPADDRDPGGIVAPVLEPGQSLEQDRDTVAIPDISDYSAQGFCSSSVDNPAQLAQRELRWRVAPMRHLSRDLREGQVIGQPAGLELA